MKMDGNLVGTAMQQKFVESDEDRRCTRCERPETVDVIFPSLYGENMSTLWTC